MGENIRVIKRVGNSRRLSVLVEFLHFDIQITGQKYINYDIIHEDHHNALFYLNSRILLVHTNFESGLSCSGKAPKGVISGPFPDRHAATRSRLVSNPSNLPTADGFGVGTPEPSPQSHPFSRCTDPFCQLPLPTMFHWPEVVHLEDLMRS
jgi:hypothetical protein